MIIIPITTHLLLLLPWRSRVLTGLVVLSCLLVVACAMLLGTYCRYQLNVTMSSYHYVHFSLSLFFFFKKKRMFQYVPFLTLKQVKLLEVFPSRYRATLVTCIMASVQSTAVGLCLDRNKAAWRIEWNLQLVTIVYSVMLLNANPFLYSNFGFD